MIVRPTSARPGIRVALPDPQTEGIGRLALTAGDTGVAVAWSTEAAAALTGTPHPGAADAFVDHVCSDAGRATYTRYGFAPPRDR